MEQIVTKLNIDLYNPTSYEVIKAQQSDTERWLRVNIKNDGVDYTIPSSATITFEGTRSDSSSFCIPTFKESNGSLLLNLYNAINVAGISEGKFVIRDVNSNQEINRLSSIPIKISIQQEGYDKNKESQASETAIDYVLNELNKLKSTFDTYEVLSASEPIDKTVTEFWLELY